jgi:hypothetical protein
MPSASAIPACAAMIQKPTWQTCRAMAGVIPLLEAAGDDRAEDRLETGLELLRQAGDLLGNVIDADRGGRSEETEEQDVDAPRAPLDCIGPGDWQAAQGQPAKRGGARTPCLRQAIGPDEGDERCQPGSVDRDQIGNRKPACRGDEDHRARP